MSTILMIMAWRGGKKLFACLIPFYMLLCGATVYIQAHYLIDAIVAFSLRIVLYVGGYMDVQAMVCAADVSIWVDVQCLIISHQISGYSSFFLSFLHVAWQCVSRKLGIPEYAGCQMAAYMQNASSFVQQFYAVFHLLEQCASNFHSN